MAHTCNSRTREFLAKDHHEFKTSLVYIMHPRPTRFAQQELGPSDNKKYKIRNEIALLGLKVF